MIPILAQPSLRRTSRRRRTPIRWPDSFPDQLRKAVTDHFDFENLMPESLMSHVVHCINTGHSC